MQNEEVERVVVRALSGHRSDEEVTRMLCDQYGMDWGTAAATVQEIGLQQRRAIAQRQSPFTLVLIIGGLLAGIGLVGRLVLTYLANGPTAVLSISMLGGAGLGLLMIIGALIGMYEMMRSLTR
jgi:hypothetical protein